MTKVKNFFSELVKKHPFWLFGLAVFLLYGHVVIDGSANLWAAGHQSYDGTGPFYDLGNTFFFAGFLLFPVGLVLAQNNRLFSEYWLAIIAESAVLQSLLSLNVQRPFQDDPYYNRPVELILYNTGWMFIVAGVVQGAILLAAYFIFADKTKRKVSPVWHILSVLLAVGLSVFLILCVRELDHT